MKKIGFIGMGNMAQAIAGGLLQRGLLKKEQVFAYAPHWEKLVANARRIGFTPCASAEELCQCCDTVIMACKPKQAVDMAQKLAEQLRGKALLSIAWGIDLAQYRALLTEETRIQYIMPNTPAQVGEGVFLFEEENTLEPEELEEIKELFSAIGSVHILPRAQIDAAGAISGCGLAFVDQMMEALADAAVYYGLPRAISYDLISEMIVGAAKLQLETKEHPGALKDAVCSPGGVTIKGICALERAGFRAACIDAVSAVMGDE